MCGGGREDGPEPDGGGPGRGGAVGASGSAPASGCHRVRRGGGAGHDAAVGGGGAERDWTDHGLALRKR